MKVGGKMESSEKERAGSQNAGSRLPWLGGFLGVLVGLAALVVSWNSDKRNPTASTAFLGGPSAASNDSSLISAADAIQNLAGAYLDDDDARRAADSIRILDSPHDRHEVFLRLFDRFHDQLNDEVEEVNRAKSAGDDKPGAVADPDANVAPMEAADPLALSSQELLQDLSLLYDFVNECDDTRLKTRCLAKLAETRLDITDAAAPPTRKVLIESARSLALTMNQSRSGERGSERNAIWQWLLAVGLPLLTGLAGTAAVKLIEAFVSELGKALSKSVVPTKENPPETKA